MRIWAIGLILGIATRAAAHDIPSDVMVHAFLKPEGKRLELLVRVPLKSIRDVQFPEHQPGYLDIARLGPLLPDLAALWIAQSFAIEESGRKAAPARLIAARISLAAPAGFVSFEEARKLVTSPPMDNSANVVWNQVMFDALFEFPIESDRAQFSIRPGFERLAARVTTVLRFVPPGAAERAFEFSGDPGLVPLDPSWRQAAWRFVALGFEHILGGVDHLLFLLCLVIPFRRFGPLVMVVTAFTLAHSVTLIASAYNLAPDALWFPPLIETLIATSIVYMALENIVGAGKLRRRWLMAFSFGLVHGFGFSFALRETLQFAGSHLLTSLVCFNLGVEVGQVLVLAIAVPVLTAFFRHVLAERIGTIILSALVAHTGWHWMTERGEQLFRYNFTWPDYSAASLAGAMRWTMLAVIVAAIVWAWRMRAKSSAD